MRRIRNILFLSPRQCYPPLSGGKLREFHLARALGRHAALTHVSFTQAGRPALTSAELPFCHRIVPVPSPPLYTAGKIARGLLGCWPLSVVNYTSDEMEAAIGALLGQEQFDLVHIDSVHMAAYAPFLQRNTRAPVIYDWHNIESEVMRRYSENAGSPFHRLYASATARRLAAVEKEILRQAFGHVVCSKREREQLSGLAPRARIAVVENGVDAGSFSDSAPPPDGRCRIVFVGSMNGHPNIEGAVWFVRSVWPGIHARFPSWRLTLVGSDPAPAVLALRDQAGVEVTGTVSDVRPYYQEALAAIVPLRTVGGTRLKILEAMAAGVPVVSTTFGAEGLSVSPGADILIADQDEDWLPRLAELSHQAELWHRLTAAGRELARRYDWDTLGESLYDTYCGWLSACR